MRRTVLFLLFLALSVPVLAGVEKLASVSDQGICPYWRPIVPALAGWVHDKEAEDGCTRGGNGISALVPQGQTFDSAPAVIYARAMYKPTVPQAKSLEQFIRNDMAEFKQNFPDLVVDKLPAIKDGDGKSLSYHAFRSASAGYWEFVAYGEEGDYYLIFTLSGKTKAARDAARRDFERLVSRYKEHL